MGDSGSNVKNFAGGAGGPGGLGDLPAVPGLPDKPGAGGLTGAAGAASAGGPGGISPMELIGKGIVLSLLTFANGLVYYPAYAIKLLDMTLSEIFERKKNMHCPWVFRN